MHLQTCDKFDFQALFQDLLAAKSFLDPRLGKDVSLVRERKLLEDGINSRPKVPSSAKLFCKEIGVSVICNCRGVGQKQTSGFSSHYPIIRALPVR